MRTYSTHTHTHITHTRTHTHTHTLSLSLSLSRFTSSIVNCQHSPATLYCRDCDAHFCSTCDTMGDHRTPAKAGHRRVPITNSPGRK